MTLIYTINLLEEYCRVARRIEGKEFSSWLRYIIISGMKNSFVSLDGSEELFLKFKDKIPKEDLIHFLACIIGRVEYLISKNREFIKKAENKSFKCVTPEEFIKSIK